MIKLRDLCLATGIVAALVVIVAYIMLAIHMYNTAMEAEIVIIPRPLYPDLTYCHVQQDLWGCIRNADYAKVKPAIKMWRNDL